MQGAYATARVGRIAPSVHSRKLAAIIVVYPKHRSRREALGVAYRLAELRVRTDDELIRAHDEVAHQYRDTPFEIRAELARRDAHRQGERIVNVTWVITRLTVMITALTAVNVGLVAVSIIGA